MLRIVRIADLLIAFIAIIGFVVASEGGDGGRNGQE